MRMEALRQTNYVKSIVTAQGKMDLERKGKQSYQGWMLSLIHISGPSPRADGMIIDHLIEGFVHHAVAYLLGNHPGQ